MDIFPELTKNTWKVLLSLSQEPKSAGEIAKENGMGLNRVSEALDQMIQCRILKTRKRRKRLYIDASLRDALRNILQDYSKERLIQCMEGKKMNILFQIFDQYDTINKLKMVTDYSSPTFKRALKQLQDHLFVFQPQLGVYQTRNDMENRIRQLYSSFFAYFLDSLEVAKITWKEVKVFGKSILIKSTQKNIPGFAQTGFSVFHKYSVDLIETNELFFVNSRKQPTKEEVFIHALVFSLNHGRDMMLCILFADLNRLKPTQVETLSMIYKVEKETSAIFEFLKTKRETRTGSLPTWQEYVSLRRDYEGR